MRLLATVWPTAVSASKGDGGSGGIKLRAAAVERNPAAAAAAAAVLAVHLLVCAHGRAVVSCNLAMRRDHRFGLQDAARFLKQGRGARRQRDACGWVWVVVFT